MYPLINLLALVAFEIFSDVGFLLAKFALLVTKFAGSANPLLISCLCFAASLFCCFGVIGRASFLADKYGEPQGTLILGSSIATLEIAVVINNFTSKLDPDVVKDTTLALFFIALNLFVALSLISGGLKNTKLKYNQRGTVFQVLMMSFGVFMFFILPNFFAAQFNKVQIVILTAISYTTFAFYLIQQTITHRDYYLLKDSATSSNSLIRRSSSKKILTAVVSLIYGLILTIALAKEFSAKLNLIASEYNINPQVIPLCSAALILFPEGLSAILAAYRNNLQKSLNLCLGSIISSLFLSIPTILFIVKFMLNGQIYLGVSGVDLAFVLLDLMLILISTLSGRASLLNGLVLFFVLVIYLLIKLQI